MTPSWMLRWVQLGHDPGCHFYGFEDGPSRFAGAVVVEVDDDEWYWRTERHRGYASSEEEAMECAEMAYDREWERYQTHGNEP